MDMDIRLVRSRYLWVLRILVMVAAITAIFLANIAPPTQAVLMLLIGAQCLHWSSWQPWACGFSYDIGNFPDTERRSGQPVMAIKLSNGRWLNAELIHYYCLSWIQILEFRTANGRYALIVLPDSCSGEEQHKIRCFLLAAPYGRRPQSQSKPV